MTKDFIAITDWTKDEILQTFQLAIDLKVKTKKREEHHILKGQSLAMVFMKPSARTRVSFEVGTFQLGGHALYLAPTDIGLGKRESVADVARTLSRYNDGIMARVFAHSIVEELAEYASVPVINGLSDYNHPCQVMGDMLTILEHRSNFEDLKIVYVGDGNNLCNSWLNIAMRIPMKLNLAIPDGFDPDEKTYNAAREAGVSEVQIVRDPVEAVKDMNVVYTDVWASMGQESEADKRKKIFASYQVNEELIKHASSDVKVMHCLPAHRGDEITDGVVDGPHSIVFDEAENRMHIQKAIMVNLMK